MSLRLLATFMLAFASLWVLLPEFLAWPRVLIAAPSDQIGYMPVRRRRRVTHRRSADSPDH